MGFARDCRHRQLERALTLLALLAFPLCASVRLCVQILCSNLVDPCHMQGNV